MTTTAAPVFALRRHRTPLSIGIAVAALAGVPAIWLPFAYDILPASVVFDDQWQLGWPYLLAIPTAAALVRWVVRGRPSNAERWCGRLVASSWDQRLQVGAYAALLTSVVYVIHILAVLVTRPAPRPV